MAQQLRELEVAREEKAKRVAEQDGKRPMCPRAPAPVTEAENIASLKATVFPLAMQPLPVGWFSLDGIRFMVGDNVA